MSRLDSTIFADTRNEDSSPILRVHSILYRILCYFDLICRNNDLNYFLDAGTLLGVKRHKGFIPWDDDIDIIMPRLDYERFIVLAKQQLPEDLFLDLIYGFNYKGDYYVPCKLRDKYTSINSVMVGHEAEINCGVSIDIFPLDKYSNYAPVLFIQEKMKKIFRKICLFKQNKSKYSKLFVFTINSFAYFYLLIFGFIFFRKRINRIYSGDMIGLGFDTFFERRYVYEDIFPLKEESFMGGKFFVPANMEKILNIMYGSQYMNLPKIENRISHIKSLIIDTRESDEICYL